MCNATRALLCFCFAALVCCGASSALTASVRAQADAVTGETTTEDARPVPVPEPSEKAVAYQRGNNLLWLAGELLGLLIPAALLFTGFSARLRDAARRIGRKRFFIVALYFALFSVITFLLGLPLAYYEGFAREHAYGLSNQTFGAWFGDALKSLAVGIVIGSLMVPLLYLILRKSPRRWWLYTGLLLLPFLMFGVLVAPVFIAPLFDDFQPMQNKALEARILRLADRAGIEGSRVYEVDKSRDTNAVNAYVTGLGSTKRIVLWDTIIKKLDEDELLFVMGHEMGHYVLGHVFKSLLFITAVMMLLLYLTHRIATWATARFGARFGFTSLADVASLPLLLVVLNVLLFFAAPALNAFSRHNEHEADRFGLEITRTNRAAAEAFVKLQTENLAVPRLNPLVKLWRATHPPLGERIDFANSYRPWTTGEPLKYADKFNEK